MRSLRAKMTLLVLLLGVPFLIASVQGLLFASEQSNLQERKSIAKRAFNRLARDLSGSNPRARIAALYEQSGLDTLGAGASLVDRTGNLLWESKHRSPAGERKGAQQLVLDEGILLYVMPEKQSSDNLKRLALAITCVGLIAYGTGAWMLVGATLKPISNLVNRVKEAKTDPSLAVALPSSDREVVSLVETLNSLIQDVRSESEERVNSYATLSHELRTPIHSLLLKLDLALGSEQSKEQLEATLVDVQRQVYRLKNLSEAVLTLQRLSQTPASVVSESVEVRALIDDIVADLQPLIDLRCLTLDININEGIRVSAPREHLVLLLRNLIENAVKHSPLESHIEVSGEEFDQGFALRINNPSDGNTKLAGNGLGLSICREVARTNGWQMEAVEAQGTFCAATKFEKCALE